MTTNTNCVIVRNGLTTALEESAVRTLNRQFENKEAVFTFIKGELVWGAAAGTCKDALLALEYGRAGIKVVTIGTLTPEKNLGNIGRTFFFNKATGNSINSGGLKNEGVPYYLPLFPRLRQELNALGSELWISVATPTFDPAGYYSMGQRLSRAGAADVYEGDYSCPNVSTGSGYQPAVCLNPQHFNRGLEAFRSGLGRDSVLAVKHAPTTDYDLIRQNVLICLKHGVRYLIFSNTIPNTRMVGPDKKSVIDMPSGGGGGRQLIPINIKMLEIATPLVRGTSLRLLAAGGVEYGEDAYYYLERKANGFLFNTVLARYNHDPQVGMRIIHGDHYHKGLVQILLERGLPT